MSELDTAQNSSAQQSEDTTHAGRFNEQMGVAGRKMMAAIDRVVPTYQTPDAMAYSLARRTRVIMIISGVLLAICIIGSLLNIAAEDFLWGIPALGAVGLSLGMWIWTSNLMLRPDVSEEAREVLRQNSKLHLIALGVSGLVILYFVGMVARLW
jgi:hypothetical protein